MKNLKIKSLFLLALVSGNTYTCWKGLDTFCEYIAGCYCCYDQELWQAKQNSNTRKQAAIANTIEDQQLNSFRRLQQATAEKKNQDQTISNKKPENNSAQDIIHSVFLTSTNSEHDKQDAVQNNITHAAPNAFPDNNDEHQPHVVNSYNMNNQETDNHDQLRVREESILGTGIEPNSNTHNASNSARGSVSNYSNYHHRLFVGQHTNNDGNYNENFYNGIHLIGDNTTLNNSPMNSQYPTQTIKVKPYSGSSSYIVDSIIPRSNPE